MRLDLELPSEHRTLLIDSRRAGEILTSVLRHEQVPLNTRCGERQLCKSCIVEVWTGSDWEARQACRIPVDRHMTVRVPASALLAYAPQVLSDYRVNIPYALDPLFEPEGLAVAIDIGTTTVALSVLSLSTGSIVGSAAGFNLQMYLGDDVLTRINLCLTDPSGLDRLRSAIVEETLRPLIARALERASADLSDVRGYVVAGNTTMLHLFAGEDPGPMGYAPFTPCFLSHREKPAALFGLAPGDAPVHLLPGAAAYVGADIVCGVLAGGLAYEDGPSILADVGTNGEIVLKMGTRMVACSTAAGPAFEGSGLSCGVRAGDGAIAHMRFDGSPLSVSYDRIGDGGRPFGLCGSAYIDFLAAARRHGLIGPTGRILSDQVDGLAPLVSESTDGLSFKVATGQGRRAICITETDIARLLQAKAAIAAGIITLLGREGLRPSDVQTLHLAGGFGMHLDLTNAISCGLLPGFRPEQVQLVGNTSLAGATVACLDRSVMRDLDSIAGEMEIVELNLDPGFEDTYIDQLMLEGAAEPSRSRS